MNFLNYFIILAILLAVSNYSIAEQVALSGDQEVVLSDGKKLSFSELDNISGIEKDNIINAMSDAQFTSYDQYFTKKIQSRKERTEKMFAESKQDANFKKMEAEANLIFSEVKFDPKSEMVRNYLRDPSDSNDAKLTNYFCQSNNNVCASAIPKLDSITGRIDELRKRIKEYGVKGVQLRDELGALQGVLLDAKNKQKEASIKQMDALLNKGYTLYISNIENGSPGERKMLNEIISKDYIPQELKNRALAILNNEKKYKLK